MNKGERTTLSAEDWLREALEVIAEQGVQALAVEPIFEFQTNSLRGLEDIDQAL